MSDFKLGEHDAMIRTLDARTLEIAKDVAEIKGMLAERRGERATIMRVATIASVLTGVLFKLGELVYHAVRHA